MFYLSDLTNSISFLHRLSHMRYDKYLNTISKYEFKLDPIVQYLNRIKCLKLNTFFRIQTYFGRKLRLQEAGKRFRNDRNRNIMIITIRSVKRKCLSTEKSWKAATPTQNEPRSVWEICLVRLPRVGSVLKQTHKDTHTHTHSYLYLYRLTSVHIIWYIQTSRQTHFSTQTHTHTHAHWDTRTPL